ncbi:MmcQ/YjbR family DNA-binding protein [Dermatophilaceae bacterium Soc4.6]
MSHPQMFDDDDPLLARVRGLALALPSAAEKVSHGRPAFFTTKVFAYFGGSQKVAGDWVQHPACVLVLPDGDDRRSLLEEGDGRVFSPAYLGPSGWLGVQLPPARAAKRHWAEVSELLDASYRATAGRRLVAQLDALG